jgi:hypothetical protein
MAEGHPSLRMTTAGRPSTFLRVNLPPYAVPPTEPRFPALAALAGRAQLGGDREVALALYLAARLVQDATGPAALNEAARAERATAAKSWLSTLALPAAIRPSIARLVETSGAADTSSLQDDLRAVVASARGYVDIQSQAELDRLAKSLGAIHPAPT